MLQKNVQNYIENDNKEPAKDQETKDFSKKMNNDGTKINGKTSRAKFSVDHDSVSCNEYAQTNILFSSRKNLFAKNYNENFEDDQRPLLKISIEIHRIN